MFLSREQGSLVKTSLPPFKSPEECHGIRLGSCNITFVTTC